MFRNVATVMRGTILGQGLGLLILPLLTRLYDPSSFGHFQLYQSATLVLVVFVSLRFEVALLRARDGQELQATLILCLLSTLLTSVLLSVGWLMVGILRPDVYNQLPMPSWMVGCSAFIIGMFQVLGFLATRQKEYSTIANSKIVQAASYSGVATLFGYAKYALGMIAADVIGRLIAVIPMLRLLKITTLSDYRKIGVRQVKDAAVKFKEFPLITVFGGLVNSAGIIITPIMIYAAFSAEIAGQFALVERSIAFPIAMIVGAISQVYSSNISASIRDNPAEIAQQYHGIIKRLALFAALPALAGFFTVDILFEFVFGEDWAIAGNLAKIMIPAYFVIFVYGGVNMTLMILGRQGLQTAWEIFRLFCMVGLWVFIIDPEMTVTEVVTLHSIVLGGVSLLFLVIAEYAVRRGPTKAALAQ